MASRFWVVVVAMWVVVSVRTHLCAEPPQSTSRMVSFGEQSISGRIHVIVDRTSSLVDRQDARNILTLPGDLVLISVPRNAVGSAIQVPLKVRRSHPVASGVNAYLVIFHPDIERGEAQIVLSRVGVTARTHPDLLPQHQLVVATPEQIAALEAWDEVAFVHRASERLFGGFAINACAGAAFEGANVGEYANLLRTAVVHERPGDVSTDRYKSFTYTIEHHSASLAPAMTTHALERALREWSRYARIAFSPGSDPRAASNINLLFGSRNHGDRYPFDGPRRVLAHAFYPAPINSEPLAGDVHLDDDETWSDGGATDVFPVLLHEVGHALGLGHSDNPDAVMYPYYSAEASLHASDISALLTLYGPAEPSPLIDGEQRRLRIVVTDSALTTSEQTLWLSGTVEGGAGEVRVSFGTDSVTGPTTGGRRWTAEVPVELGVNRVVLWAEDANGEKADTTTSVTRLPVSLDALLNGRAQP